MRKLRLIFDLDAIIANLLDSWLEWYNQAYDDDLIIDDLTSYHLEDHVKPECGKNVFKFFHPPERYGMIPILPGASEGLSYLRKAEHDILICTATAGSTAQQKYEIVKRAAPWIKRENIFIGSRKEVLKGDVFIDDAPKNILSYRKEWPQAKIATISYPYNVGVKGEVDCYAQDHNDTAAAWSQITKFIDEVAAVPFCPL